jgi:hypothetical protein
MSENHWTKKLVTAQEDEEKREVDAAILEMTVEELKNENYTSDEIEAFDNITTQALLGHRVTVGKLVEVNPYLADRYLEVEKENLPVAED